MTRPTPINWTTTSRTRLLGRFTIAGRPCTVMAESTSKTRDGKRVVVWTWHATERDDAGGLVRTLAEGYLYSAPKQSLNQRVAALGGV